MEGSEILLSVATYIVVQFAIIYYATYASRSTERQHAKIQTQLMVRMARQAGIDEAEIQESLNA